LTAPTFRRAVEEDIPASMRIRLSVKESRLSNPARVTHATCSDHLDRRSRGADSRDRRPAP
jgi:hypothetical protein